MMKKLYNTLRIYVFKATFPGVLNRCKTFGGKDIGSPAQIFFLDFDFFHLFRKLLLFSITRHIPNRDESDLRLKKLAKRFVSQDLCDCHIGDHPPLSDKKYGRKSVLFGFFKTIIDIKRSLTQTISWTIMSCAPLQTVHRFIEAV